jgi:transposase InsO family protein
VLSILDVFSRLLWLRPLPDKATKAVVRTLKTLFMEWPSPQIIQTNQGSEFKGKFDQFCQQSNIKHVTSRAHHPQSQGKDERLHQSWKSKLWHDVQNCKKLLWVKKLRLYQSLYNNGYHVSIGMTPNECFWSRCRRTSNNAVRASEKAA